MLMLNGSLFFENWSLFFWKSEFVFIENRMADSQVIEDLGKEVSACQD